MYTSIKNVKYVDANLDAPDEESEHDILKIIRTYIKPGITVHVMEIRKSEKD